VAETKVLAENILAQQLEEARERIKIHNQNPQIGYGNQPTNQPTNQLTN
jgi:hypothetical protein